MTDLDDGESTNVAGSGSSVYTIKNVGGVYSCTCPAWRNQSIAIETRTCKHIRRIRGDAAEELRVGSAAPSPRSTKTKVGKSQEPPVLLAESWDGSSDVKGWWISEKLDGVRAFWDGKQFLSRQGNRYLAPDWFTSSLPPHALDGELWLDRKKFQRTISIVRRQDKSEHWRQIRYLVFDAPHLADPFEDRVAFVKDLMKKHRSQFVEAHAHLRCKGIDHLKDELARVESLGGEGLMLRQPASKYVSGRSSTLLKVKTFHDAEAEVIDVQGGAGRHKGRMGALLVRLADGTQFSVGTGFSDAQRNSPPPVGSMITFRYQELTDGGVPRFPSYVGLQSIAPDSKSRKLVVPRDADKPPATRKPVAKASKQKAESPIASAKARVRYFTYQDHTSDKFWEVTVTGCDVTTRYGKTGSNGQSTTKNFPDEAKATKFAEGLVSEKTKKGYVLSQVVSVSSSAHPVEIIAHRGESADAPENTLAAFELAWSRGISSFELDCRLSKDNQLIVIHDADTKRTSNETKLVTESTADELCQFDAGKWKHVRYAGVKFSRLPEVFAKMPTNARCFVEVKVGPEAVPALVAAITESARDLRQFAVISFDADTVAETKKKLPGVKGYLVASFKQSVDGNWTPSAEDLIASAKRIGADGLDLGAKGPLDAAFVKKVKDAGLELYVWTVDDWELAQRLARCGVDGLTTNKAGWLRDQFQSARKDVSN